MSLFGQTKRHTTGTKPRRSPLPIFTPDPEKKFDLYSPSSSYSGSSRWFTVLYVPLPRFSRSSHSESILNGNGFSSTSKNYHSSHSHSPHRSKQYLRVCLPIIQSDTPAELVSSNSAVSGPSRLLLLLPAGIQEEQRWTEYLVTTIRGSEYSHLDTRGAGDDLGVGGVERALPKHATT